MAHKPWITAGFVTVCCSMSRYGKQNFVQPFFRCCYYSYTHELDNEVTSWISGNYVIMDGPYLKWTQLVCVIWRYRLWAARLCLSRSVVAFSRSISVVLDSETFVNFHESFSTRTCAILKCMYLFVQFKFSVYGHTQTDIHTYIHTHTHILQCNHASVGLAQARSTNIRCRSPWQSGLRLLQLAQLSTCLHSLDQLRMCTHIALAANHFSTEDRYNDSLWGE